MKPRAYSTQGVVLRRRDFSDADRIITIYSKDYGKLSLLAKSVKKPKSKKRGHLEVFNRVKFSGATGRGLDIITEVETLDSFQNIRNDLRRISVAYYLAEVVDRVTKEEEINKDYYGIFVLYLEKIKTSSSLRELRLSFVRDTLILLGFWPQAKPMENPDSELEKVIEREVSSARIGKKILT